MQETLILPCPPAETDAPVVAGRKRAFRARNRAQTEERIVEAALRVFGEKGYERATFQDLAEAAGIVRGTLYQYCPTKEDVMLLILQRAKLEQEEALTPPSPLESTVVVIERIIEARTRYLERLRPLVRALGRQKVEEVLGHLEARLAPERARTLGMVEAVLRRGIERGELRDVDPGLTSRLLAGMLTPMTYQAALRHGDYTPAEIARAARDLIVHALVLK